MAGLVAAVSLEGCGLLTKSYDFTEAENSIYVEDESAYCCQEQIGGMEF